MNRLTTDDEKSIMYHLNTFYAKNGEVWVRNGGPYHKDIGWVVDKLTREKMISLHVERVPGGNHRRKDV